MQYVRLGKARATQVAHREGLTGQLPVVWCILHVVTGLVDAAAAMPVLCSALRDSYEHAAALLRQAISAMLGGEYTWQTRSFPYQNRSDTGTSMLAGKAHHDALCSSHAKLTTAGVCGPHAVHAWPCRCALQRQLRRKRTSACKCHREGPASNRLVGLSPMSAAVCKASSTSAQASPPTRHPPFPHQVDISTHPVCR